jgi:hypothetical protein
MSKHMCLLLGVLLCAGCLDEGRIRVHPDRIEVDIQKDSWFSAAVYTAFFLDQEKNPGKNPVSGRGRPVIFNSDGIVPPACNEFSNCSSRKLDFSKPVFFDKDGLYLGEPGFIDFHLSVFNSNPDGYWPFLVYDQKHGELAYLQKIRVTAARVGMRVLDLNDYDKGYYAHGEEEFITTIALAPKGDFYDQLTANASDYLLAMFSDDPYPCQIEEWLNELDQAQGCDGSNYDYVKSIRAHEDKGAS